MKYRYLFISIFLLLAICAFAFFNLYRTEKGRKINELLTHQKIYAKQATRSFTEMFDKYNSMLYYLSKEESIVSIDSRSKAEFKLLFGIFNNEIKGISRIDKSGTIIYTSQNYSQSIGTNISQQPHVKKILNDHSPVVSDVFNAVQGYRAVIIHYPVFKNGKFDGTIAFLLNFQIIAKKILDEIKIGKSGFVWLLSHNGMELYGPVESNIGKSIYETTKRFHGIHDLALKMLSGKEGSEIYIFNKNYKFRKQVEKSAYYCPIKINNTFWSIAVVYLTDEIANSLISFQNKLIIIFSFVLIGGILISYYGLKAWIIVKESHARIKAENALKESEEQFLQLIDQLPQLIFRADANGSFNFLNKRWLDYTGIDESICLNVDWQDQIHPDDKDEVKTLWNESIANGNEFHKEFRIRDSNKKYHWFNVQCLPLRNNNGIIVNWFGSCTDIQHERDIVKTLTENEERYRLISWATSDYMFVSKIDKNGFAKTQWVAGAFETITGYTFDEYIKRGGWRSMLFPEDIELDEKDMEKLRANQSIVSEIRTLTKTGKVVWVRVYAHPAWDEKTNSLVGINGAVQDITERKLAEEELKKLYTATEQSPAAIVITDINGYVEYVNSTFTKISGYLFAETKGKILGILSPENSPGNVSDQIWKTIKNGLEWEGEYLNIRKDGIPYWESTLVSPIKDNNGKITHLLATQEDITEKKKSLEELILAKEKAEEVIHVKNVFLANMSHELRTPLIGILGYSEMLANELIKPEKLEMAHGIIRSGNRLLNTLNLILDLTRIESDRFEINLKIVNLIDEIYYTFNTFKGAAHEKRIDFTKEIRNDKLYAKVDERMFRIIMENLINNAIKFTTRGSVKIIADIEDEKTICISVNDTGIGIPEDYLDLIFEEFRQVSEGINRDYQGTGLGLSISKKYVTILGGTVSVQSRSGVGSSFFVRFPLAENFD
jgi:PAS domain S-box-containing protein